MQILLTTRSGQPTVMRTDTVLDRTVQTSMSSCRRRIVEFRSIDELAEGYPSKCSLGQVQTKVEKKNERDEVFSFL